MNHRFTRNLITVGSHAIVVAERSHLPRTYQAVCKSCEFTSLVGTASVADKAALAHRDETIAAFVELQLTDFVPAKKARKS